MAIVLNQDHRFEEVVPPLEPSEAMDEALRCYYCYDAPCIKACPTGINIPVFIRQIANHDVKAAARTIMDANILGATCARICPTEALCEGGCVRKEDSRPVSIGRLQRVAMDHAMTSDYLPLPDIGVHGQGRVAVVGAGPAGLGAAAALTRMGYVVEVFEEKPEGGGLDTYGIVSYREPLSVSLWEVDLVHKLGTTFHFGTRIGRDIEWEGLRAQFDAVIIAVGLGRVPKMGIPGEDLAGVWDALDLVEATKTMALDDIDIGRQVAVIGAGNTAVDAATCAKRLGAEEVTIVYRRDQTAMSAYQYEYEFAKQDGVSYKWWTVPVQVLGNHRVQGLRCARTQVAAGADKNSREADLQLLPGSEFVLPVDTVIRAIGQTKPSALWDEIGAETRNHRVVVDDETFSTSLSGVYAIGDCLGRGGEATVVAAVADGKKVAWAVHQQLTRTNERSV